MIYKSFFYSDAMHYSDCYKLIKKLNDKDFAVQLKKSLKALEKDANNPNFIAYLKQAPVEKSISELRKEYDLLQLTKVVTGIETILQSLPKNNADHAISEIETVLKNIKKTANQQKLHYHQNAHTHYANLAKKYATHFIPFDQSNDPFKGSDFNGYCWGHSHRYGRLASMGVLDSLSVASDKKLYTTFKDNWSFADILFRRVGWYFAVRQEIKIRNAIWDALKQLDEKSTLNFNFLVNTSGFHSTALRMVGNGVEYYENNYGLVKFNSRENAVNFLTKHLLHQALQAQGEVSFITVYKLPYDNNVEHDVFADLPQAVIHRESSFSPETETMPRHPNLMDALTDLENYISELETSKDVKARIKANELKCLFEEFKSLSDDMIGQRVGQILENKNHSLMINRGTGFYFFASGFKSHSTTETLLQAIHKATLQNVLSLK
ncbi:hypothetical protein [Legionella hackeliae]|uniref:Uncharacterized protein n=1 Tax=Legionella hackeliae TaxID=449 RepID=A0A0A8UNC3_LEGHA|nr:hypothetical protein [Legionella hackeliae]KTD14166.1 hypothetical protein Lhac_0478 [Legionella hackeliae]CEK10375.1 protein of unknown function [Legionella hackeliae]STX47110.1 Uncharacterised protein [Legionella hackeliae]